MKDMMASLEDDSDDGHSTLSSWTGVDSSPKEELEVKLSATEKMLFQMSRKSAQSNKGRSRFVGHFKGSRYFWQSLVQDSSLHPDI